MEKYDLRVGQKFNATCVPLFVNRHLQFGQFGETRIQEDPGEAKNRCLECIAENEGRVDCSGCIGSDKLDTETPIEITDILEENSRVILVSCHVDGASKNCNAKIRLDLLNRCFVQA